MRSIWLHRIHSGIIFSQRGSFYLSSDITHIELNNVILLIESRYTSSNSNKIYVQVKILSQNPKRRRHRNRVG